MHIDINSLVIITEPKIVHFDLSIDVDNNLSHEIDLIIQNKEILAEHAIKIEISHILSKHISMETIFMNSENRKMSEPLKFFLNLPQRLGWRSSNKHVSP